MSGQLISKIIDFIGWWFVVPFDAVAPHFALDYLTSSCSNIECWYCNFSKYSTFPNIQYFPNTLYFSSTLPNTKLLPYHAIKKTSITSIFIFIKNYHKKIFIIFILGVLIQEFNL